MNTTIINSTEIFDDDCLWYEKYVKIFLFMFLFL